jgi:hypothetical protein
MEIHTSLRRSADELQLGDCWKSDFAFSFDGKKLALAYS